jgi:hypothetical protein
MAHNKGDEGLKSSHMDDLSYDSYGQTCWETPN